MEPEQNTTEQKKVSTMSDTPTSPVDSTDNHSVQTRVMLFVGVLIAGGLLAWVLYSLLLQNDTTVPGDTSVQSPTVSEPSREQQIQALNEAMSEVDAAAGAEVTSDPEADQAALEAAMLEIDTEAGTDATASEQTEAEQQAALDAAMSDVEAAE